MVYNSNNVSVIVQSIANVALCNPFSVFSNNCDTLNATVAFNPNAISNVNYICILYNDWFSNIDELVQGKCQFS